MKAVKNSAVKSAALIIGLLLMITAVGCSGSENGESSATESINESINESSVAANDSQDASLEESTADNSTYTEDSRQTSDETAESEGEESGESESSEPEYSEPEVIEPEILGEGTKDSPFLLFPDKNMTLETFEIEAGKSQFYSIYRVGGMNLTLEDKNASVKCDGVEYKSEKGKVFFHIYEALASDSIPFEIFNNGSEAKKFTLSFTSPAGTYGNPEKATSDKDFSISLEEGNEKGYYYIYIAEKDGTVTFTLNSSKDSILVVTNNATSAQRTTEADGSSDGSTKYVEIDVSKGDELIISVGALPNARGKYPKCDITWSCTFK